MAVKLIANYAKRLGLPGYSSHQFSVSIETELHDVTDIAGESIRLYQTLQQSVDEQIQQTGFVPPHGYGMEPHANGDGSANTNGSSPRTTNNQPNPPNGEWQCTPKQQELILSIVADNRLEKEFVESLAVEMFGQGVRSLNRLAASGLIDELFERYPRRNQSHSGNNGTSRGNGTRNGYRRNGRPEREAA